MANRIPVRIHPLFWLFAALIGFINSQEPMQIFIWVIVILISVLVHEFGHALTGLLFSQKVAIELFAFGGVTYRQGSKLSLGKEFLVVLAGPFFGFILFLISYFFLHYVGNKESLLFFALNIMMLVNLLWTIINLIPVLPLDGGHLFTIIMEKLFGFKGIKAAHLISFILGGALTIVFFVMNQLFLGILFFMLAFTSFRAFKQVKSMTSQDQDDELKVLFEEAERKLMAGDKQGAKEGFIAVRERSKSGLIYKITTETLALLLIDEKQIDEAYKLLSSLPKISPELLPKYHELSFRAKDYAKTVAIGEEAYQLMPTHETALFNALAYAQLHDVEPAVGWLECALNEGVPDLDALLKRSEFDPIREDVRFKEFKEGFQE